MREGDGSWALLADGDQVGGLDIEPISPAGEVLETIV